MAAGSGYPEAQAVLQYTHLNPQDLTPQDRIEAALSISEMYNANVLRPFHY